MVESTREETTPEDSGLEGFAIGVFRFRFRRFFLSLDVAELEAMLVTPMRMASVLSFFASAFIAPEFERFLAFRG